MAETNEGCPRLKMGYESCDAPLCDCPRAKETTAMSEMRKLRYAGTDWRSVAVLEECERGHEFVKLPDYPLNGLGHAACPHCLAVRTLSISLDQDERARIAELYGALVIARTIVVSDAAACKAFAGPDEISEPERVLRVIDDALAIRQEVEEVPYCGIVVVPDEGD